MASPTQDNSPSVSALQRSLTFKQLQINRLLEVTQAINDNVPAPGLYKLYKDIMGWEMRIKKMVLLFHDDAGNWQSVAQIGFDDKTIPAAEIGQRLVGIERPTALQHSGHTVLDQFEVVVPVFHKKTPIAYALLGTMPEDDDRYEQIKFVTTITNIIAVAIENKRLFKRQLEQERLKHELHLAAQVQSMLVPTRLPENELYEFSSIYMPHEGIGGDYYDLINLSDESIIFCIADISGKGIAAALLMSNFQANLQALAHKRLTPEKFIHALNKTVRRITHGDKFITMFIGRYNTETRQLIYVNAGHTPPLMLMDGEIHRLNQGCTILGAFKRIPFVEIGEITLSPNTLIMMYTDGLTDMTNDDDEYLSDDKLADFMRSVNDLPASLFNDKLMEHIHSFRGSRDFPDDISVLTCRLK